MFLKFLGNGSGFCVDKGNNCAYFKEDDKILFLDMPPEASIKLARERVDLKNGQSKDIHEKDDNHLINAYEKANFVAKKYNWIVIDCVKDKNIKSIDEIHKDILTNLGL